MVTLGFIGIISFDGIIKNNCVSAANTLFVHIEGGGNYTSIQEAIDNSSSGDTIYVWTGYYNESIIVNKSITLIGNGTINTTINGTGMGDVVLITSNWVNITGFTIINSGEYGFGSSIDAGIELNHVENVTVYNNEIKDNVNGIFLNDSKNNLIDNNSVYTNSKNGILVKSFSRNNTIENNICYNNYNGISIEFSIENLVKNNNCSFNINGTYLTFSDDNHIENNIFCYSDNGIYLNSSNYNIVKNNTCIYNTKNGLAVISSINNMIQHNNCSTNDHGIFCVSKWKKKTITLGAENPEKPGHAMGYVYKSISGINYTCKSQYYADIYWSSIGERRGWAHFNLEHLTKWSGVKVESVKLQIHDHYSNYFNTMNITMLDTVAYEKPTQNISKMIFNESGPDGTLLGQYKMTTTTTMDQVINISLNNAGISAINNKITGTPKSFAFGIGFCISSIQPTFSYGQANWGDIRIVINFTYTGDIDPMGSYNYSVAIGDDLSGHIYNSTTPDNKPYGYIRVQKTISYEYRGYFQWQMDKIKTIFPVKKLSLIDIKKISVIINHDYGDLNNINVYNLANDITSANSSVIFTDCGEGLSYYSNGNTSGEHNEYELALGLDGLMEFKKALINNSYFGLGFVTSSTTGYSYMYSPRLVIEWQINFSHPEFKDEDLELSYQNKENKFVNNTCIFNNLDGIYLLSSNNNTISNNEFSYNNHNGINLENSCNNSITNNNCTLNLENGIYLISSKNNNLFNNSLHGSGLRISGDQLQHWNSHKIDNNNLINNKPIYYLKDQNGSIIPNNIGQVILANCKNISINDLEFSNCSIGIQLGFSDYNMVSSCIFRFNNFGIYIYGSHENTINNCTIDKNEYIGIIIDSSSEFSIINTSVTNSKMFDIQFNNDSHALTFNCSLNWSKIYYVDPLSTLTVHWFLHIFTANDTGIPVSNADVQVKDHNENIIFSGSTDIWGRCNWILCKEYTEKKSGKISIFTPHNISVSKIGFEDTTGETNPIMNISKVSNITIKNDITPPEPPANLVFTTISGTYLNFSWDQPIPVDVYGYNIYINQTGSSTNFKLIDFTQYRFYNATGLVEETAYHFEIKAYDDVPWESTPLSGNASTLDLTKPYPPTGLTVTKVHGTYLELTWNPSVSNDVMGYQLYINDTGSSANYHFLVSLPSTSTKYNHTGLLEEVTYYYKLRAFDEVPFYSIFSNIAAATTRDITPPLKPKGLKAIPQGVNITLKWNANSEADLEGYKIFMNNTGKGSNGPYHLIKTVNSSITQYTFGNLAEETTYYFRLVAFDEVPNYSPYSAIANATTFDITAPCAPTGLVANAISGDRIKLTWDTNIESDLAGYHIYMADSDAMDNYYLIHSKFDQNTTYIVTGLQEEKTYFFKLRAFDEVPLNSPYSNIASATTLDETPPAPPTGLTVSNPTDGSLTISWDKNQDSDVIGYYIYRAKNPVGTFKQLNSNPITTTQFIDSGLTEQTRYYYKLKAVDDADLRSDFSELISGLTRMSQYPPEINNTIDSVDIYEDTIDSGQINTYYLFKDVNNDPLEFWCEGQKSIEVSIIQSNGKVTLKPDKDWYGSEIITFYASDKISKTYTRQSITINVLPVNDPPKLLEIISPKDGTSIIDGERLELKANCFDPDLPNDTLEFFWYRDDTQPLGKGELVKDVQLPIGENKITVIVYDTYGEKVFESVWVTVLETPLSDSDGDDLPNEWERQYELNPNDPNDRSLDPDEDGLTNIEEYLYNLSPQNRDCDNDDLTDGDEIKLHHTNASNPDTDGDGYADGIDKYPLDETRWEEEIKEKDDKPEATNKTEAADNTWIWVTIIIIIVFIVLLMFFIFVKPRLKQPQIEQEPEPKREIKDFRQRKPQLVKKPRKQVRIRK